MKLGLNIPNFGPTATPDIMRAWVRFAQDHGYALAMLSDHVAPTPDVTAVYPSPFYDPFATLSWLAGLTDRVELGTTVAVAAYRHPLLTARLATNIDQFSGGRFVLGVGVGWSEPEFTALGLRFSDRGRVTDEYLQAIVGVLRVGLRQGHRSGGERLGSGSVSLDGHFVRYQDVDTGPASVRQPHLPVWVGGSAPAAIRRAVRFGQAWHPINPSLSWLREKGLPMLRAVAADQSLPVPAFCPRIKARLADGVDDRPLGVGTFAQIRADVEALRSLGASYVVLDTNPDNPADRQPLTTDWALLARISEAV
jgi:probable F420-dependent oxidoreductase